MLDINCKNDHDEQEIIKSVVLLDMFAQNYCEYRYDHERFGESKFRCGECPFRKEDGPCLVKAFKIKYAPEYRNFGEMNVMLK